MGQVQRNDPCPCGSGKKYKKCCLGKKETNRDGKKFWTRNKFVYFSLIAIFALSIFLRYYGFGQPHRLTFDEGLYSGALAKQLQVDATNYSPQRAYEIIKATGRFTPEYLNRPLFKHPPLYCYLIALGYHAFNSSELVAVSVSIWLGSLMVLTIFFLGKVLYDDRVGLLAAFYLCIDPVHWVCSERIWMETTLSFFILLAILLFILGQKQKIYLTLSGLSIGLAMLTKYPGILSMVIIVSSVILMDRSMLKQKGFWIMCTLALIVFCPWIIWNWNVYGSFLGSTFSAHDIAGHVKHTARVFSDNKIYLTAFLFLAGLWLIMRRKISNFLRTYSTDGEAPKQNRGIIISCAVVVLALMAFPFLRDMGREAFIWRNSVLTGWSNPFAGGPWHFYITRLAELSPVYIFAYLSIFFVLGKNKGDQILLLSSSWILIAFILLGNYQSRYILPAVPFLIILAARWQIWAYDKLSIKEQTAVEVSNVGAYRAIFKIFFISIGLYFTAKTLRVDWLIAIGPDFGYF